VHHACSLRGFFAFRSLYNHDWRFGFGAQGQKVSPRDDTGPPFFAVVAPIPRYNSRAPTH